MGSLEAEIDPRLQLFDPELYDLVHRGNPGDIDYYRQACAGAESVLELGCGSGRVACALARDGVGLVVGLDRHPGMLQAARRRAAQLPPEVRGRLRWIEAEMGGFELDSCFARIAIPYNGLLCLLDDRSVLACLSAVRRHLAPGGRLLLDVYRVFTPAPDTTDDEDDPDAAEPVAVLSEGQRLIEVFERSAWDVPSQRLDAWYDHRICEPTGSREVSYCIPQRYLFPDQLERLLEAAGLEITARYGDFRFGPFDEHSDSLVLEATAPSAARGGGR